MNEDHTIWKTITERKLIRLLGRLKTIHTRRDDRYTWFTYMSGALTIPVLRINHHAGGAAEMNICLEEWLT